MLCDEIIILLLEIGGQDFGDGGGGAEGGRGGVRGQVCVEHG